MATSGTYTYSATAAQAIQEALEILGVLESGRLVLLMHLEKF